MPNAIGPRTQVMMEPVVDKSMVNQNVPKSPDDIIIPPPAEKKEGSSALAKALTGLAIASIAGYLLYNLRKGGEIPVKTLEAFKAAGGEIKNGIAKNADGSRFEGILTYRGKGKDANSMRMVYQNGRLQKAFKNFDGKYANPEKPSHYMKEYIYDSNGKLSVINRTTLVDGEKVVTPILPKNIKTVGMPKGRDFEAAGCKFVDGKPVNADGSDFNGLIVEKLDNDVLIREFKDGKQISEKLNTKLNGAEYEKGSEFYSLDAEGLAKREDEVFNRMVEAEKAVLDEKSKKETLGNLIEALGAKKQEDAKPLNRVKNFFSNLFSSKKP